jgi:uncharacterized membrane protein YeiB
MTEYIPYFAGLITFLFGVGFYLSIDNVNKKSK